MSSATGAKGDPGLAVSKRGAGERVVLVHGFSQNSRSWEKVAGALASRYEVLSVDLPGHGESDKIEVQGLLDAAELLASTGGEATYVGYSLGGRTCLTLALLHPALVKRLVLIGATPGIVEEAERSKRRAADEALADRLDPPDGGRGLGLQAFLSEWLSGPLFAHLSEEQADVASRLSNTAAGLAGSLRTMGTGTQAPAHERLGALEMPVLLLAGERDAKFAAIASEMAEQIGANATVSLVANAGHAAPFEAPATFIALLESWLLHSA